MNNQPIGVLDSGVGGLSIWQEITQKLPNESTIYLADSKNCPYGTKSTKEIYDLSKKLVVFLLDRQCKMVVLACNTITVSCLEQLRADFPHIPIIGTVPVVKTAAAITKNKKIGILSTVRTAESEYQKHLTQKFATGCEVVTIGTDKLVPLIEAGKVKKVDEVEKVIKEVMQPFQEKGIDTLALGCSHFPFVKDHMQKILGPHVVILDSKEAIARQVERVLTQKQALSQSRKPSHVLYTTGSKKSFQTLFEELIGYNRSYKIQQVDI